MKSLFVRLVVSLWLTLTLIGAVFALIHAWAFASQPDRRPFTMRTLELRGEAALQCEVRAPGTCARFVSRIDPRDYRVAIYRDGAPILGEPIDDAASMIAEARAARDGFAQRTDTNETVALVSLSDPRSAYVGTAPARSRWMFFIVPQTLPYRLLAIVLVSGVVAALLARYLARPIRELRRAAQSMASGDLSVRVSPRLGSADRETVALGADMDRMAERIAALLEGQRRLLRDVSHELRSPLARLGIALELVRRRSAPDVTPALDRIERETERLNFMIGELLTLSRLESNTAMDHPERFELRALVEQVVGDVSFEAERHDKRIVVDAPEDCLLDGREELLRRAFENVLRNAVRFTDSGTTVEVALACESGQAVLSVRDHGPGVPNEALVDIFKPFHRIGDDRARSSGGTGIGLAITDRAVAMHGGSVVAQNAEGGGLSVAMTLPAETPITFS